MKKGLRDLKIVDVPDNELEMFIRFLDRDTKGRISYEWFLTQIKSKGDRKQNKELLMKSMIEKLKKYL